MASEQIGNDSYVTMTPGSAVAGQLQNILTQRRLEARQDMLDKLNAQNTQSEIAYRDQNARSLEEDRLSKVENRKAQELGRRAGVMSPHMNLDPQGADYKFLQQEAPSLIDPAQAGTKPMGPDDVGPEQPATPPQFHGLPTQLDAERKRGLQADLQKLMADPQRWEPMPDAQKEALYREAYGASIPETVLRPKVGGKIITFDEAKGTYTYPDGTPATSKGPNDTIERRPRAPIGPAQPNPTSWEGTEAGPNGEEVPVIYQTDRNGVPKKVPFPDTFRIHGKAGTAPHPGAVKPPHVTDGTWKEWLGIKQSLSDPNKANDPNVANLADTQASRVISESTRDTAVRAFLTAAWGQPMARTLDAQTLLSKLDPTSSPLTAAQRAEAIDTWNKLRLTPTAQ